MTRASGRTLLCLAVIFGLTVTILGGTTAQAARRWFMIYIPAEDMRIDLGVIDGSCYDIATDSWCAISDGQRHRVRVYTNNPGGLVLTVAARDTGGTPIDDLADLQMKGGDLAAWTGLASEVVLKRLSSSGSTWITDIEYHYQADEHDSPGDYQLTVRYTVTSP